MAQRKQNSTNNPIGILMVSSTDSTIGMTGLASIMVVTLSKNNGAFAAALGTITEVGNGWYSLAGNATDRNTLGELIIHATATGADPYDRTIDICPWDAFDTQVALDSGTALAGGSASTFTSSSGTLHAASGGYAGMWLLFTSGVNQGTKQQISTHSLSGSTHTFSFGTAFKAAPGTGDPFVIG